VRNCLVGSSVKVHISYNIVQHLHCTVDFTSQGAQMISLTSLYVILLTV